jgi:hypothetical protein
VDLNAITGFGTGDDGEIDSEGRNGDFAAGPQLLIGSRNFFGSLTSGPATMGVTNNIGFTTFVSIGGATL